MKKSLKRRQQVLNLLYKNQEEYLSGEDLSNKLGVSRTSVWKYIKYLREVGYQIESSPRLGYRLVSTPKRLLPEEIKRNLKTEFVGQEIFYYEEVESTNIIAKDKAQRGAKEGTVVIAKRQAGGKGRLGREFTSPTGGMWLSCILRPDLKPILATRITYVASLALARTINQLTSIEAKIKWPNDILIEDKKVSGILTELGAELDQVNYLIVGIGVNLNFPISDLSKDLSNKATTIMDEVGHKLDIIKFIQLFLKLLEEEYNRIDSFKQLLSDWKKNSYTLGQMVRVEGRNREFIGKAVDIALDGALVVEDDNERRKFYSGDVSLYHQGFNSGN